MLEIEQKFAGADFAALEQKLAAWGARVERFDLPGREAGGFDRPAADRALARADLAVDAMFGTGFTGPLEGDGEQLVPGRPLLQEA